MSFKKYATKWQQNQSLPQPFKTKLKHNKLMACTKPLKWKHFTIFKVAHEKHPTTWRRHDMEMLSTLLALCGENPLVTKWFPLTQCQKCRALMYSLLLIWTSCWTNSRVIGDLKFKSPMTLLFVQQQLKCHDAHVTSPYWKQRNFPPAAAMNPWK